MSERHERNEHDDCLVSEACTAHLMEELCKRHDTATFMGVRVLTGNDESSQCDMRFWDKGDPFALVGLTTCFTDYFKGNTPVGQILRIQNAELVIRNLRETGEDE